MATYPQWQPPLRVIFFPSVDAMISNFLGDVCRANVVEVVTCYGVLSWTAQSMCEYSILLDKEKKDNNNLPFEPSMEDQSHSRSRLAYLVV